MKSSTKKTVGAYAYELQQKEDPKINPIELQREIHKGHSSEDSFESQVRYAVKRGEEENSDDFYVVVLFKKERTMKNVVRQYFFPRESCPTPEYDQIVYHYFPKDQKLEMLWVVPDKQSTLTLPFMAAKLPPEQQELIGFVKDFNSGKLDQICELLNKEYEKKRDR